MIASLPRLELACVMMFRDAPPLRRRAGFESFHQIRLILLRASVALFGLCIFCTKSKSEARIQNSTFVDMLVFFSVIWCLDVLAYVVGLLRPFSNASSVAPDCHFLPSLNCK